MCSVILSQWRECRIGVMWQHSAVLTTTRAREFWICWRRVIWDLGRLYYSNQVWSKRWRWQWCELCWNQGMDGSIQRSCLIVIASFGDGRNLTREGKMFCSSSKMNPRLRVEWVVLSEELCILLSCFLSPMSKNSVLEELTQLRVRRWQLSRKRFAEGHSEGA